MSLVRIRKELTDLKKGKSPGIFAELVGDDLHHWRGTIAGPDGTAYQGGYFVVDIILPKNYPFSPPKMRFETKLWHPNISSANGAICLDILKNEWSPALTLRTAMLSLQALLSAPNPEDPQDAVVAEMYLEHQKAWYEKASQWTRQYAQPEDPSIKETKLKKFLDMGFTKDKILQALAKSAGDETKALNLLVLLEH